jgi:hypothetical protein
MSRIILLGIFVSAVFLIFGVSPVMANELMFLRNITFYTGLMLITVSIGFAGIIGALDRIKDELEIKNNRDRKKDW